jgi:VanZ family protein
MAWSVVAVYAGFVAYMSLRRFGDSPIDRAIDGIGRAYFHLPAYAGLAALLALAMSPRGAKERRAALAFVVATAYGWVLEVAQIATPTRSFNLRGLVFDAAGAAAGGAAIFLFTLWRERARRET